MQQLKLFVILALGCLALAGCADSYPGNPPGAEANSGKTYSAEDARAIQQPRGSDSSEAAPQVSPGGTVTEPDEGSGRGR